MQFAEKAYHSNNKIKKQENYVIMSKQAWTAKKASMSNQTVNLLMNECEPVIIYLYLTHSAHSLINIIHKD